MPQPSRRQPSHGAKAIALDQDKVFARYRLSLLIAMTLAASLALGLHIIFWR